MSVYVYVYVGVCACVCVAAVCILTFVPCDVLGRSKCPLVYSEPTCFTKKTLVGGLYTYFLRLVGLSHVRKTLLFAFLRFLPVSPARLAMELLVFCLLHCPVGHLPALGHGPCGRARGLGCRLIESEPSGAGGAQMARVGFLPGLPLGFHLTTSSCHFCLVVTGRHCVPTAVCHHS